MKNFRDYLAESAKSYVYFIKFAVKPASEQVENIESWLKRYDLKEFTSPTLVDDNHKDFIDVQNRNVHSMKIVLGLPISQYILLQDLKNVANVSEKLMAIRGENEPIELYSQFDAWERKTDREAAEDGEVPGSRLSTDREYTSAEQPQVDDLFGNEYNKKLLTYLAGVAEARPTMNVDPPAPLFSWIQMEDIEPGEPRQDTANFNAHIKGAPMPITDGNDSVPVDGKWTNNQGTMSDDAIPQVKFFKDSKTGKAKQVLKPTEKK
jgi:hypothetical protein